MAKGGPRKNAVCAPVGLATWNGGKTVVSAFSYKGLQICESTKKWQIFALYLGYFERE